LRNNRPNNILINVACVSKFFQDKSILMNYNNLMTAVSDIKNNSFETISDVPLNKDEKQHYFESKTMTLSDILKINKINFKVDFLCIDVEGYELEVLQGIDFKNNFFEFILIETAFQQEVDRILRENYTLLKKLSHHDYLYSRRIRDLNP
jgi:FkbM family methyltransferase